MAKKKKRPAGEQPPPAKPAPPAPFHAPFAGLKKALKAETPPAPAPPAPPAPQPLAPEPGEEELFAQAMAQVERLESAKGRRAPQPEAARPYLVQPPDEDLEVMAQLADLVSGAAELDLRFTDEYVQGCLPGVGPELMERLGRGEFPLQDYLDLHGMGQDQARQAVEAFLGGCQARGLRHVLVVHGKGAGSPEGLPVLKRALAAWLNTKRLRRQVLAFCTALPRDGGTGAMYLLLRKWRAPGQGRW